MSDTTPCQPNEKILIRQPSAILLVPIRRPRGPSAPDVAVREHVVVVRRPTPNEITANPINIGKEDIVHISSRTGRNVYDLSSDLIITYKRFKAGPGSQARASEYRSAAVTHYIDGGSWRFTEALLDPTNVRQVTVERSPSKQSPADVRRKIALVMEVAREVPGTAEFKQRSLNKLMVRSMSSRSRGGEIKEGDELYNKYAEIMESLQSDPEKIEKELASWVPPQEDETGQPQVEALVEQTVQLKDDLPFHAQPKQDNIETVEFFSDAQDLETSAQHGVEPVVRITATLPDLMPRKQAPLKAHADLSVLQSLPQTVNCAMPVLVGYFEKKIDPVVTASAEMSMATTSLGRESKNTPTKKIFSRENSIIERSYNEQLHALSRHSDVLEDIRNCKKIACDGIVWLNDEIKMLNAMLGDHQ